MALWDALHSFFPAPRLTGAAKTDFPRLKNVVHMGRPTGKQKIECLEIRKACA